MIDRGVAVNCIPFVVPACVSILPHSLELRGRTLPSLFAANILVSRPQHYFGGEEVGWLRDGSRASRLVPELGKRSCVKCFPTWYSVEGCAEDMESDLEQICASQTTRCSAGYSPRVDAYDRSMLSLACVIHAKESRNTNIYL